MSVLDSPSKSTRLVMLAGHQDVIDLTDKLGLVCRSGEGQADVARVNDSFLGVLGASGVDPLPPGWLDTDAAHQARGQIKDLIRAWSAPGQAWLIRDPRLCLVAPLWTSSLEECGIDVVGIVTPSFDESTEASVSAGESWLAGRLFKAFAAIRDEQAWASVAESCREGRATFQLLAYIGAQPVGGVVGGLGEARLANLVRRVDELETENKAVYARLESSHRATDRMTLLQLAQARELAELQGSQLWRVFVRFRGALGLLPAGWRRHLRRALKALWWAATPWRLPARFRYLRERAASPLAPARRGKFAIRLMPPPAGAASSGTGSQRPGSYVLTEGRRGYTYVPPRKPVDLDVRLAAMHLRPRFSLVVPVYNTPPSLLDKLVNSVLAQWYPDWELILVNDNSSMPHVREDLARLSDPRIVVLHLKENKRISLATNEGLARASGDYIVFADHDDELTSDCLYELACCIERESPDFIYSDEDKIDETGCHVEPFFKPAWSPDALMSTMYTCHVSCARRELVNAVGGLRPDYDGAQDWDFVLRIVEKTDRIAHIPKVLYHWRIIPASVASDLSAKPYAITAGKRAREAAMERRGLEGVMEPVAELPGYFRAVYSLRGRPKISIVIPSKNNYAILKQCIDSIESMTTYENYEIVLIDNGSSDPSTVQYVDGLRAKDRFCVLSYDKPFNYSAINNLGAVEASGDLLLFLNDDTEVLTPNWLERLGGYAQQSHVGAVGAKLLYPGGERVQHVGIVNLISGPGHAFLGARATDFGYFARAMLEYDWMAVTGACLMVERSKFARVGGFDENFPVAYNDVDLCFRLVDAGLFNVVNASVTLIHHESYSRGSDDVDPAKQKRLKREMQMLYLKHPQWYQYDPFHSPNLAVGDVGFGLPQ